jgi:two-component system sensor histidine kinase UhpB
VLRPEELLPETGGPEAKSLIAGFNTMLGRLETERRASARRTLSAIEGERRRIGRELHDEIGQRLTGTLLELQRLADDVPEPFKSEVRSIQEQQRAALDEVGALAWQLRPALLDDLGLAAAVRALGEDVEARGGPVVDLAVANALPGLSVEAELAIFRAAQEALANVVRHAEARTAHVTLEHTDGMVRLTVRDDGRGFSPGADLATFERDGHLGLVGMRERIAALGGTVRVMSTTGVTVTVTVPEGRDP